EHLLLYLVLAFGTLARPSALLELRRSQIDFENRLINLNQPGRQQTKKYRPALPMAKALCPWLKRAEGEQVIAYHGKPVASIKTAFTAAREKAGLDASVTPYTIRHTMATELRRRGVPQWEVGGMLGHQSAGFRTTEIYAKFDPTYLGKAIEAIDAYFTELDGLTACSLLNH
ncbi:MAG: site-specific integrase, partial [Rhodospirillaceae bacterium]